MPDNPLRIGFNVPFSEAIKAAQQKRVVLPEVYYGELQGLARKQAFSISGLASLDQLTIVRDSLAAKLQNGQTFRQWQKDILESETMDLPRHRLDNIFRTNIQSNYNRGRWERFTEGKAMRPYLMYDAINDSRVRPTHLAMDGIVRPVDDPFWKTHAPLNGYRCRCRLISLSEGQARARSGNDTGLNKGVDTGKMEPDKGFDYNPGEDLLAGVNRGIESRKATAPVKLVQALDAKISSMEKIPINTIFREPWKGDFPMVDIYAKEGIIKSHESYLAAKTGNIHAALDLVKSTISKTKMKSLNRYRELDPILVPVVGIEGFSDNVIPNALAAYISDQMRFKFNDDIVQTNKAGHTGSDGWWRLLSQASFDGDVVKGANYILVDDFVGMGGTFANLRGFIKNQGGNVIKTVSLTGKPRSATLSLQIETLDKLREKHGDGLEKWWSEIFGYGFAELTESEANYLIRAESFESIRNKIIETAKQGQQ